MGGLADVTVRQATESDHAAVRRLVDAAMLVVEDLEHHLHDGGVLVACTDRNRVIGTIVIDEEYVVAIAVTRSRRGQGIGTQLIHAAAERTDRLVAEFDRSVRPFYETLEFEIESASGDDRLRGVYRQNSPSASGSYGNL
jgi:GNAT superfamily N-acetyltransferase